MVMPSFHLKHKKQYDNNLMLQEAIMNELGWNDN